MPCDGCNRVPDYCSEQSVSAPDYLEKQTVRNNIDYQRNRVDDEPWQYVGGNMVSVHIRPLSQGLLGYTDTKTSIHLTTPDLCKPFDINPREVDFHEKNHFGCWDEYENRRQVEVNRHLWDLGELPPLEQPEEVPFYRVEKDNSSVDYTVYQG